MESVIEPQYFPYTIPQNIIKFVLMIGLLIIFFIVVLALAGWLLLIAGAGMCIDDKCPPLNISPEENKALRKFEKFFHDLTNEQQKEYLEKIKDPNYSDAYTPYIRDLWNDSSEPAPDGEVVQNDLQ